MPASYAKYFWEIPAGLRDIAGETPVSAAQRELLEETGLEAEVWEPLVSYFPSPGCSDEKVQLYAALNPRESAEAIDFQREAEEAELAAQWWDLAEVCSAIFRGSLCSSVVVAGILAVSANSQEWIAKLQ
ncbi:NUDIX hydrolase [Arcanobacterium hippocoleae]